MEQYILKSTIVAEIKRRIFVLEANKSVISMLAGGMFVNEFKDLLSFINTLEVKKEPVSKDLEEAARRIATRHSHITGDTYYANDAWFFKKGAQWQKEQMIDKACEWLSNVCTEDRTYKYDNFDSSKGCTKDAESLVEYPKYYFKFGK